MATNEQKALAREIFSRAKALGDAVELAHEAGMSVSCDVGFNEGSESMVLHQLNGEFSMSVRVVEEIEEEAPLSHQKKKAAAAPLFEEPLSNREVKR